eukprot:CAMPEP_0172324350 /NCGR_PEP_ID=MMETSP1058-20130122/51144_1 /TAXON_ID=83371 /ORGANISM="Detonula confervacea, Strain CCMP 353" /LENGTH=469 /DNA_ID=CAMNT_0013040611 /DNA_START=290 /DNA_END=1696 /DNA_ORIENTATION=+
MVSSNQMVTAPENSGRNNTNITSEPSPPLTPQQINTYLRDGILVVDNLLSCEEIANAQCGLVQTLKEEYGVDVHDLEGTGHKLVEASSTNGAGGVLDIFYPEWKMKIATNETLFRMTRQLWKEAYCHNGENIEELLESTTLMDNGFTTGLENCAANDEDADAGKEIDSNSDATFKWHPFGAFDCNKGYMYIDRIGYRIPTKLAVSIGKQLNNNMPQSIQQQKSSNAKNQKLVQKKKKSKPRPIQRSLTPHFDCCPEKYHDTNNKNKWRPIQCFVSLTDNLQPNTGGFEGVPGFHREFRSWVENGRQFSSSPGDDGDDLSPQQPHPQQCVGEYTHLSPSFDRDIMQRMQHIPVRAGSVVFWDNRIPHGNSYRNDPPVNGISNDDYGGTTFTDVLGTSGSRAVVYCSFLPDVQVNRSFVQRQLDDWKIQRAPRVGDRWIRQEDNSDAADPDGTIREEQVNLSELGKRLIGL